MSQLLTETVIKRVKYEGDGLNRCLIWDSQVPGLVVRIYPSGKKSYALYYRIGKRTKIKVLGSTLILGLEQARILAKQLLVQVAISRDFYV